MNRIVVNSDRVIGAIDRRILGGFLEHMGRCVYGGVFDEQSPLSDNEGFRTDVIEAVRALKPPVLRWPGGNFVSGYHFTDGIGPVSGRPTRFDAAWRVEESNRFGTDEFMRYCELVGAEPYLCLNMGTGTLDEAREWLEYCNFAGRSAAADRRRANGRDAPYGVRYWGLGNEVYGDWQIGHKDAKEYVRTAREWAKVLTWTDPDVELVACGDTGWSDWDEVVVDGLAEFIRWYSLHIYTGSEDYWSDVLAPHQAERAVRITAALIEKARYNQRLAHPIHVAYDEWNVRVAARHAPAEHEETYTLADALAVATYLHAFVRRADVVKMANLAQLVNVLAPIMTSPTAMVLQSIYHPLRIFADHLEGEAVDVAVSCPSHDLDEILDNPQAHRVQDLGPFPVLDVVASRSSDGRTIMLSVVNRSPEDDVTAAIELAPGLDVQGARFERVHARDWRATNTFDHPDDVNVSTEVLEGFKNGVSECFPAHSHTVLSIAVG
ncbi:MAG: hypothetical protein JWO62_466 [Acidimicrobiaceae bacterium]|nr:hypothetical protein [Acidimicrobiaceae bacterium]